MQAQNDELLSMIAYLDQLFSLNWILLAIKCFFFLWNSKVDNCFDFV